MTKNQKTETSLSYLVRPETVVETAGAGQPLELGALAGKPTLIVLRVTETMEQESLQVSIWGSPDGNEWGEKALFWYPQKFYVGATPAALDLQQRPEIKFLQARWEVNRWGRGYPRPRFKFSVEIEKLVVP